MINNFRIIDTLAMVVALLFSLVLHENAHGVAAYFMGDDTAKNNGRLSLNPLKHLSLVGTLSMLIFKIGWAKPVPINPYKFKNRRLGNFLVSIAGVTTNIVLAFIMVFIYSFVLKIEIDNMFLFFLSRLVFYLIIYNVYLAVFNLIPIPPLDGSKIIYSFLPEKTVYKLSSLEKYSNVVLILLIVTRIIPEAVGFLAGGIFDFMNNILRVF